MLTKWVSQAWKKLYANQSKLIRQTFCKLSLLLAVYGAKNVELSIKDLPGIMVGDWKLASSQVNEQQVEDPIEIDESTVEVDEVSNLSADTEYVFDNDNGAGNEKQAGDKNSNSELEDNNQGGSDLESNKDE